MDLIDREKTYEVLTEYYHHRMEIQHKGLREALAKVPSVEPKQIYHEEWRPLEWEVEEMVCDIPWEYDGKWIIVTDGISISVERIKKDAFDHFFPRGRLFDLTDTKAWMPMPEPYARMDEVEE